MAAKVASLPQTAKMAILHGSCRLCRGPQGKNCFTCTPRGALFWNASPSRATLLRMWSTTAEPLVAILSLFALWCPHSLSRKGELLVLTVIQNWLFTGRRLFTGLPEALRWVPLRDLQLPAWGSLGSWTHTHTHTPKVPASWLEPPTPSLCASLSANSTLQD